MQKLILPGLILAVVLLLYFSYFAPTDELGSFTKFDPNNNASIPIVVKYLADKPAMRTNDGGVMFYVVDKNGTEMQVSTDKTLPPGIQDSKSIVITGHLSGNGFHAHGVELRN